MTKQQEMEALRAFVDTLPKDSYIQPMLVSAMPMIERDIRSDIEPDLPGYNSELLRRKEELENQLKALRQQISDGNDAVKKQKSEVERLARQSVQLRKQLRDLQESLVGVLQW